MKLFNIICLGAIYGTGWIITYMCMELPALNGFWRWVDFSDNLESILMILSIFLVVGLTWLLALTEDYSMNPSVNVKIKIRDVTKVRV